MGAWMVCNMERWRDKASTQRLFGGVMKVGDLVRYSGSKDCFGIVIKVCYDPVCHSGASKVQWANGVTSNHSNKWLIRVKTSEDT